METSRFEDIVRITPPLFPDGLAAGEDDLCVPRVSALPMLGSARCEDAAPAQRSYVCLFTPIGASIRSSVVEGLDDLHDEGGVGVSLAEVVRRRDSCCASDPLLYVIAARKRWEAT